MKRIEDADVDSVCEDVAKLPPAKVPHEMERATREQPELLDFILGSTEGMSAGVGELSGFICYVIWRVFRANVTGPIPVITGEVLQRILVRNEEQMASLDESGLEGGGAAWVEQITPQPALLGYVVESLIVAEENDENPVRMEPEEKAALVLLLKTAIEALDEACTPGAAPHPA